MEVMTSLSSRQKRSLMEKEALARQQKIVDYVQAVDLLHPLAAEEIRRLCTTEAGQGMCVRIWNKKKANAVVVKAQAARLLRDLPLHLLGCLLLREPGGEGPASTATAASPPSQQQPALAAAATEPGSGTGSGDGGRAAVVSRSLAPLPDASLPPAGPSPSSSSSSLTWPASSPRVPYQGYHVHLGNGLKLLAQMCRLSDMVANLADARAADNDEIVERVVDLTTMCLLTALGPEEERLLQAAAQPRHWAEAQARLDVLGWAWLAMQQALGAGSVTAEEQLEAIERGILWHPEGDVLVTSSLDALTLTMCAFGEASRAAAAEFAAVASEASAVPAKQRQQQQQQRDDALYNLAYPVGMAMEIQTGLLTAPGLYQRLMSLDPGGGAALRLIRAGLQLPHRCCSEGAAAAAAEVDGGAAAAAGVGGVGAAPLAAPQASGTKPHPPHKPRGGAAELLAARSAVLIIVLEEVSLDLEDDQANGGGGGGGGGRGQQQQAQGFLERAWKGAPALAADVADATCNCLSAAVDRPICSSAHPPSTGEAWLTLNCLRAAEMMSDSALWHGRLADALAAPMARALTAPPHEFAARWCAGDEVASLYYGEDLGIHVSPPSTATTGLDQAFARASKIYGRGKPCQVPPALSSLKTAQQERLAWARRYSLEHSVLLFQLLGNLGDDDGARSTHSMHRAAAAAPDPAAAPKDRFARRLLSSLAQQAAAAPSPPSSSAAAPAPAPAPAGSGSGHGGGGVAAGAAAGATALHSMLRGVVANLDALSDSLLPLVFAGSGGGSGDVLPMHEILDEAEYQRLQGLRNTLASHVPGVLPRLLDHPPGGPPPPPQQQQPQPPGDGGVGGGGAGASHTGGQQQQPQALGTGGVGGGGAGASPTGGQQPGGQVPQPAMGDLAAAAAAGPQAMEVVDDQPTASTPAQAVQAHGPQQPGVLQAAQATLALQPRGVARQQPPHQQQQQQQAQAIPNKQMLARQQEAQQLLSRTSQPQAEVASVAVQPQAAAPPAWLPVPTLQQRHQHALPSAAGPTSHLPRQAPAPAPPATVAVAAQQQQQQLPAGLLPRTAPLLPPPQHVHPFGLLPQPSLLPRTAPAAGGGGGSAVPACASKGKPGGGDGQAARSGGGGSLPVASRDLKDGVSKYIERLMHQRLREGELDKDTFKEVWQKAKKKVADTAPANTSATEFLTESRKAKIAELVENLIKNCKAPQGAHPPQQQQQPRSAHILVPQQQPTQQQQQQQPTQQQQPPAQQQQPPAYMQRLQAVAQRLADGQLPNPNLNT